MMQLDESSKVLCRVQRDGLIVEEMIPKFYFDDEGNRRFNMNVRYSFPVNDMQDIVEGSVTVLQVTCLKDELVTDGYGAIRRWLHDHVKVCPVGMLLALGFTEVLEL